MDGPLEVQLEGSKERYYFLLDIFDDITDKVDSFRRFGLWMTKSKLLIPVILVIFTSFCSTRAPQKQIIPITPSPVTLASTRTLPPKWTPSLTIAPSSTPTSTHTPEPTHVRIYGLQSVPDIPPWLSDPANLVLMQGDTGAGKSPWISFINVATNESYDLLVSEIEFFSWLDATHVGFIPQVSRGETMYVLNLHDGQVIEIPLSDFARQFVSVGDPYHKTALSFRGTFGEDDFYLFDRWLERYISFDGRYRLNVGIYGEFFAFEVATGDVTVLLDPTIGFVDAAFAWQWSPNNYYVAELQNRFVPNEDDNIADRLSIYDASNGKLVIAIDRTIPENQVFIDIENGLPASLLWSPEGNQIFFAQLSEDIEYQRVPCLLTLRDRSVDCLYSIPALHKSQETQLFTWSRSSEAIRYVTCDPHTLAGRFCTYTLRDGSITCREFDFLERDDHVIVNYSPSPDGKYLIVVHDSVCPGEEIRSPSSGIYNWETGDYNPLPSPLNLFPLRGSLWRPLQ